MANCLVTKLNGTVDNSELLKLDEVLLTFYKGSSNLKWTRIVSANNGTNLTFRILSGGYFTNSSGSENQGTTKSYTYDSSNQYIKFSGNDPIRMVVNKKYDWTKWYYGDDSAFVDFDWSSYGADGVEIQYPGIYTQGEYVKYNFGRERPAITYLNIPDVESFAAMSEHNLSLLPNLTRVDLYHYGASAAVPNNYPIARMAELIRGNIRSVSARGYFSHFVGDVEDFIRAARNVLPTCSEFRYYDEIQGYNGRVYFYFNGTKCPASNTISWTENTMTCNGVTIEG